MPDADLHTCPVYEFDIGVFDEMALLARVLFIESAEHAEAIEAGQSLPKAINLVLTPDQALRLSAALKAGAQAILAQRPPPKGCQH